jgi:glycosyltransferase involved in cell wall biosynthesis
MDASIIIPTRDRAAQLDATLAALQSQEGMFETIVVDDGSTDNTEAVSAKHGVRYLKVGRKKNDKLRKAAEARNAGAKISRGKTLIFLDSDMVPSHGFVNAHMDASKKGIVVLGIRHDSIPGRGVREADAREAYFTVCSDDLSRTDAPWFLLHSHNFSVSRHDFDSVGGFSESFDVWGIEDQELGYRLHKKGCRFVLARDCIAVHQFHAPEYGDDLQKRLNLIKNAIIFHNQFKDPVVARMFGLDREVAVLNIGGTCNNSCRPCTQEKARSCDESRMPSYASRLPAGWKVLIRGQEPTLDPSLFRTAKLFEGRRIEIETNGRAFAYMGFCKEALASGIKGYLVHVHGHDAALHDSATMAPGSFSQTAKGISNLLRFTSDVGVKILVSSSNIDQLGEIISHYRSMGVPSIHISLCDRRLVPRLIGMHESLDGVNFDDNFMRCIIKGNMPPLDIRGCRACGLSRDCRGDPLRLQNIEATGSAEDI